MFKNAKLELDDLGWVVLKDENESAVRTSNDGVFVAGTASGPKDIPDSVLEAAAAASESAAYLTGARRKAAPAKAPEAEPAVPRVVR